MRKEIVSSSLALFIALSMVAGGLASTYAELPKYAHVYVDYWPEPQGWFGGLNVTFFKNESNVISFMVVQLYPEYVPCITVITKNGTMITNYELHGKSVEIDFRGCLTEENAPHYEAYNETYGFFYCNTPANSVKIDGIEIPEFNSFMLIALLLLLASASCIGRKTLKVKS